MDGNGVGYGPICERMGLRERDGYMGPPLLFLLLFSLLIFIFYRFFLLLRWKPGGGDFNANDNDTYPFF